MEKLDVMQNYPWCPHAMSSRKPNLSVLAKSQQFKHSRKHKNSDATWFHGTSYIYDNTPVTYEFE